MIQDAGSLPDAPRKDLLGLVVYLSIDCAILGPVPADVVIPSDLNVWSAIAKIPVVRAHSSRNVACRSIPNCERPREGAGAEGTSAGSRPEHGRLCRASTP